MTRILNSERKDALSGSIRSAVVFLHGYGADGNDLISLANYFQPTLPDAVFLSPNAPEKCGMNPMGYQWFDFQSGDPATIWKGVLTAADTLNNFIDEQLEHYNLTDQDLALVGFSQGCMISAQTVLKRQDTIKCLIGFSGKILNSNHLNKNLISRPEIYLMHGDKDDVVPINALLEGKEFFIKNNYKIFLPKKYD